MLYFVLMTSAQTTYDSNKHDTNQSLLDFQRSLGQIGSQ